MLNLTYKYKVASLRWFIVKNETFKIAIDTILLIHVCCCTILVQYVK